MIDPRDNPPSPSLARSAWALLVALVCAGGAGHALAQTPPPQNSPQNPPGGTRSDLPPTDEPHRFGEGTPPPNQFHLDLTAGARSNSNAFFDPVDGSPQQDYVGTFLADFSAQRSSPRTNWSLHYVPLISHYQTYGELDSTNHAFNFAGSYRLGAKGGLYMQEHFTLSNDPIVVSAPQVGDSPILTTNNSRVLRSRAEIRFDHEMTRTSRFNIGASNVINRYDNPDFDDSDGLVGTLGVDWAVGRHNTVGVQASGGRLQFDEPDVPDVTSESASMNWSHGSERSRLEISGGATVADQTERNTFFSGNASYFHQVGRNVELGGGWRRSLTADIGNTGAAIGDRVFGSISGRAGQHVNLFASADYGARDSTAGADPVTLHLWGASFRGQINMGARKRWGLVGGANIRRQETITPEIGTQNVNNYYVGISCRAF